MEALPKKSIFKTSVLYEKDTFSFFSSHGKMPPVDEKAVILWLDVSKEILQF